MKLVVPKSRPQPGKTFILQQPCLGVGKFITVSDESVILGSQLISTISGIPDSINDRTGNVIFKRLGTKFRLVRKIK